MTAQDIITAVRDQLVEPFPAFFTTAAILRTLDRGQKNYVRRTRVCQSYAFTSAVAGQSDYPMPTDWLGSEKVFYNVKSVNGGPDNWVPLIGTSIEKLSQEAPNFMSTDVSTYGVPNRYYVENQTLFVYPRPVVSGTADIYMFYESKPLAITALDSALSIDDTLAEALEAYLLWRLYKMDQEPQLAEEERVRYEGTVAGGSGGMVGAGLAWKKRRLLDGRWKIDIQSFVPFSYGGGNNRGGINPLNI